MNYTLLDTPLPLVVKVLETKRWRKSEKILK